ncbi:FT-interacting protein 1-like [Phragmites australis]|uniref:FT-interacting protein 1-like n=1 Tax=Phragmites australis TaxID=29695 RepID=UPI002D78F4D0|nr:FT-interacting protein 1-like [Phragmites australis]
MAYPYVFRAQSPPVRVEDHKVKDAVPVPQAREQWPAGGSRSARAHGAEAGWLGGLGPGERLASAYDLVETMRYLYVRVVKARGLPAGAATGGCSPCVEVRVGNYRGTTRHCERKASPEWNQVFAFSRERVLATALEVFVRDKDAVGRDDCVGRVAFDIGEAPVRVPPDSPLAPQWYRLGNARGECGGKMVAHGEVMLAVWVGTQADEAFADAWHADAGSVRGLDGVVAVQSTRSKVYVTPKLWYLRIIVLEAQDVVPPGAGGIADKGRHAEVVAKVQVGGMMLKTRPCTTRSPTSLAWNEEMVFVVAEPFEEPAVLIIEARVHSGKDEIVGRSVMPLALFEKRLDRRPVQSQWFSLEPFGRPVRPPEAIFAGRVHLRACLEGAYHVMEEPTMYASDTRPSARQLWRPPIGVLEVGVLGAQGLTPMKTVDGRGTTDAYCVAKYGQKWVRTRTIVDSCSPRWNEQYTWEVYDPCTVLTLAVFDNCHLGNATAGNGSNDAVRDQRIGKVRIRLSTLEMDKVYTNAHPLVVLHPSGLRKNGELCLAVRLTCLSLGSVVYLYSQPLLPKMHYIQPFTILQLDALRRQAMSIVAARLSRAEPPLRREVVEYMLDADSHVWSIRRSKANFFRVTALLSGAVSTARWLTDVCRWKNPATTILVHMLFVTLMCFPELILPTMFLYISMAGLWNYRRRPRRPPHMDARLSCAEVIHPDELDEELDTFPTSRPNAVVRVRYDRLRSVAGRIQTVVGDVATQGERVRSLLAWRDPRATALFTGLCLVAATVLYVTPVRVVALVAGLYVLRHPRFRSRMPSTAGNFFKRLPSRADTML